MIALVAPLAVTLGSAIAGAAADGALGLTPRGASRAPLLVLVTLVAAYLASTVPIALAILVLLAVATRARRARSPSLAPLPGLGFWIAAGALVLVCLSRPEHPILWDDLVWLSKARLAAPWPSRLVRAALDPNGGVIPSGYPLFYSLASAWLGGFSSQRSAVAAGAAAFDALACVAFLGAVWDSKPGRRLGRVAIAVAVLVTCPIVLVHLRAAYVDLPVGLLAATLALSFEAPRPRAAPAVLAIALVGLKDEGLAHVLAVLAVATGFSAIRRSRRRLTAALVGLGCGATAFAAWRLRLASAGVPADHALNYVRFDRAAPLARMLASHARDRGTWGATLGLGAGAWIAAWARGRRAPGPSLRLAATLSAQAVALGLALLCGPDRLMEFAANGTLLNRLIVQLVPMVAALTASWI